MRRVKLGSATSMRWAAFAVSALVGVLAVFCVSGCRSCARRQRRVGAEAGRVAKEGRVVEMEPKNAREAVGKISRLDPKMERAFEPHDHFELLKPPRPGEWLHEHPEPGQTFSRFVAAGYNKPDPSRHELVLQPIGSFSGEGSPDIEELERFAEAYFMLPVESRKPLDPDEVEVTSRKNPFTRNRQLLAPEILDRLKSKLPADAFAMLGITMTDLYPDPSWNFVFGMASFRERVGVFSFCRYDPDFYGEKREDGYRKLLLRRSIKVLAHETLHMFGLQHCVYYRCIANGSNHLREADRRPIHLCPVCLRKLHHAVGFDVGERYRALLRVYRHLGFEREVEWVKDRLSWIEGEAGREPMDRANGVTPHRESLR
jgi:archaemetzincin